MNVATTFTEECQVLLSCKPTPCSGFLRTKNVLYRYGEALGKTFTKLSQLPAKVVKVIPWTSHFVVLHDGVLFIFKDETSKKPERRIRILNYRSVKAVDLGTKDITWPFCLSGKNDAVEIFSASSREEQQKWIKALVEVLSNNSFSDSDYEEPTDYGLDSPDSNAEDRASLHVGRGPLPAIPKSAGHNGDRDQGVYEDPDMEAEGSGGSFQSDDSRSKFTLPPRRPQHQISAPEGHSGSAPSSSPLGPRGFNGRSNAAARQTNRKLSDTPAMFPVLPMAGVAALRPPTSAAQGRPPGSGKPIIPPPSSAGEKVSPNPNKKTPLHPPVLAKPKPTMKISPQPKKPPPEVYDSVSSLPYEINLTLREKAIWSGSAEEASSIMAKLNDKEGAFLLRTSSKGDGYTMHVICNGASKKFGIKEENNIFHFGGMSFKSLDELIDYLKNNNIPNHDIRLGKPYSELYK